MAARLFACSHPWVGCAAFSFSFFLLCFLVVEKPQLGEERVWLADLSAHSVCSRFFPNHAPVGRSVITFGQWGGVQPLPRDFSRDTSRPCHTDDLHIFLKTWPLAEPCYSPWEVQPLSGCLPSVPTGATFALHTFPQKHNINASVRGKLLFF